MPLIDKSAWLHLHDGRILSTRSRGKDRYYLPGGKREPGETDADTLLREIREELTVTLDPASLQLRGVFTAHLLHELEVALAHLPILAWLAKALSCAIGGLLIGFVVEKLVGLVKKLRPQRQ